MDVPGRWPGVRAASGWRWGQGPPPAGSGLRVCLQRLWELRARGCHNPADVPRGFRHFRGERTRRERRGFWMNSRGRADPARGRPGRRGEPRPWVRAPVCAPSPAGGRPVLADRPSPDPAQLLQPLSLCFHPREGLALKLRPRPAPDPGSPCTCHSLSLAGS